MLGCVDIRVIRNEEIEDIPALSNRTFGKVLDSMISNRTPTGMGLSSLEAELKALYSVVAPRAGSDGGSPLGARSSESP
jgi:hypothetical protein